MTSLAALIAPFETPHVLDLRFAGVPIRVLSNDREIATRLARYYAPSVADEAGRPRCRGEPHPGSRACRR